MHTLYIAHSCNRMYGTFAGGKRSPTSPSNGRAATQHQTALVQHQQSSPPPGTATAVANDNDIINDNSSSEDDGNVDPATAAAMAGEMARLVTCLAAVYCLLSAPACAGKVVQLAVGGGDLTTFLVLRLLDALQHVSLACGLPAMLACSPQFRLQWKRLWRHRTRRCCCCGCYCPCCSANSRAASETHFAHAQNNKKFKFEVTPTPPLHVSIKREVTSTTPVNKVTPPTPRPPCRPANENRSSASAATMAINSSCEDSDSLQHVIVPSDVMNTDVYL